MPRKCNPARFRGCLAGRVLVIPADTAIVGTMADSTAAAANRQGWLEGYAQFHEENLW
jgi:hypothetical protein